MTQVSVHPATAVRRSPWRALRPLLILGGFVAVWWALMTGVAQAESTPQHHGLDALKKTTQSVKTHVAPVRDVVKRVDRDVKATTSKATKQVHDVVRPATKPVVRTATSVVSSTPVVKQVTQKLHTTVSETVAKTRELVRNTAAAPVVDTVDEVVSHTIANGESSTVQGDSPSIAHPGKTSGHSSVELLSSALAASGHGSATTAAMHRGAPSIDDESPADSPFGTPSVPDPCASPSGSGSSSFTPVGIHESSLLVVPTVLRDHCSWRLARLPGGPAYEPGSSPD